MGWARTTAIIAVTITIAAYSLLCALSAVAESNQPALGTSLPFPSGFADANQAAVLIADATDPKHRDRFVPSAGTREQIATLSRRAYVREPLASQALRNLGLVADSIDDRARARLLMNDAELLTRRDASVNTWLLVDRAREKDFAGVLHFYDVALRSDPSARARMLPPLAEAIAAPQLVAPVVEMLSSNPPWEDDFWTEAFRHDAALDNLAAIRLARARAGYAGNLPHDRALLDALVDAEKFASAESLYDALAKAKSTNGEIVHNSDFSRASLYPPLDWQLYFSDSLTADLLPASGVLRIAAFDESPEQAARQLVALPGDAYVLAVKARGWKAGDKGSLYAKVVCAEGTADDASTDRLIIDRPNFSVTFRKPVTGCTYNWLELFAQGPGGGENAAFDLDSLSIRPQR